MKTESQTREDLIDKALANADGYVSELQKIIQTYHIKNQRTDFVGELDKESNLFADYVLLNRYNKHTLGLEQLSSFSEIVHKAFADFISTHTYFSTYQIQFLEALENFIAEIRKLRKSRFN